jgi:hypothetical protein
MHQLLGVSIGHDEIHTAQIRGDHIVDGIGAAAAHADNGDSRREVGVHLLRRVQVQGHVEILPRVTGRQSKSL